MKKYKINALILILILFTFIGCGLGYYYNKIKSLENLFYPGVKIQNVELSGKTKEEAVNIIKNSNIKNIGSKKINIKSTNNDKAYTLEYSKVHPTYDIDGAVQKAFSYGKGENFFVKIYLISKGENINNNIDFTYNKDDVESFLSNVEAIEEIKPVNASLCIRDGKVTFMKEKSGYSVDKDKLLKEAYSKINGEIGLDTDIDIQFKKTEPKFTAESLKEINALIGSFNTVYLSGSSQERANNIELAVKSINGKVIKPDEVFSFNETVGERTLAKGYKYAPVIVNNKLVNGIGGGICQVSTTLYNAAIRANMSVTERNHHSLPVHYVSTGMDATVDYGNLDLKFKNSLKYPVYIEATTFNGRIVINLYSHK